MHAGLYVYSSTCTCMVLIFRPSLLLVQFYGDDWQAAFEAITGYDHHRLRSTYTHTHYNVWT